jgi:hypothetical protein
VTFSFVYGGVDSTAPFSDFNLVTSGSINGAFIANVIKVSDTTYTVVVNTGSGNGTIRLDVIDDDSIVDASGRPLGGPGAGNGNFNTGEIYTIDKSTPAINSIIRGDPDPVSTDRLHFTLNFSGNVTGVGADDFILTTSGGVSGASIQEISGSGSTYIVTVNPGVGDGTLRLDLVDNDTIIDAANVPLGGLGVGNGNFNTGEAYSINKNPPTVGSSLRADPNPTTANTVRFLVQFSEAVSGVDPGDFAATINGNMTGVNVTQVMGVDATYAITVNSGAGNGTIRLDVIDNDSIMDAGGLPLGGVGTGNGNFAAGEVYTLNRPVVKTQTATFRSNGANDGWVLESAENAVRGGTKNANASTFYLGDDMQDRQYRAILHFPTSSLPDKAVVTQVILVIKKQGMKGTDPFTILQNILIDIRKGPFGSFGPFGNAALQAADFQAPADLLSAGMITNNPVNDSYWSVLNAGANPYINLKGVTQIRLMFQLDDNDDLGDDYMAFFSGDARTLSDRPLLQVDYYIP